MPYVYTLYWRAMQFGEPMLRPLFYDFEQDPRAFDDCDDFLLGPNLLVAPIVAAGQRARSVYLPRGPAGWVDLWTGAHYRSGMTVDAAAPLERIPLYAPAGAVIPTTDTGDMRRLHDEPSRALRLFPGRGSGASAFTLYEDDGATLAYQDGTSATVGIDLEWTSRRIRLRASVAGAYALPCRTMRVRLPPGESRRLEAVAEGIELIAAG
jgi:alpha-glucosidase